MQVYIIILLRGGAGLYNYAVKGAAGLYNYAVQGGEGCLYSTG